MTDNEVTVPQRSELNKAANYIAGSAIARTNGNNIKAPDTLDKFIRMIERTKEVDLRTVDDCMRLIKETLEHADAGYKDFYADIKDAKWMESAQKLLNTTRDSVEGQGNKARTT